MRFKVEENLPREIVQLLLADGHDAISVGDQRLSGAPDESLAQVCQLEQRALITLDLDFANIRSYPPDRYAGLIVLRLSRQDKQHILAAFLATMQTLGREPLEQHLWIVQDAGIRIWPG